MKSPKNRKKYIIRGLALFLSILLILTDPIGYRIVYAEGELTSESQAKQEAPKEQVCSGEKLEKPPVETNVSTEEPKNEITTEVLEEEITTEEAKDEFITEGSEEEITTEEAKDEFITEESEEGITTEEPKDDTKIDHLKGDATSNKKEDKDATASDQSADTDTSPMASDPANNKFDLRDGDIKINDGPSSGQLNVVYGIKSKVIDGSNKITVTTEGGATDHNIVVNAKSEQVNLEMLDVNIVTSKKSGMTLASGSVVDLTLSGSNIVKMKASHIATMYVPIGAQLTIVGSGTLEVTAEGYVDPSTGMGYAAGAAIGGMNSTEYSKADCGTIIIKSGTLNATGDGGAAIGGGTSGIASNITIMGGTVIARGQLRSAAIGSGALTTGSNRTSKQNITITGGNVTAYSLTDAAAIGGGLYSSGGNITITGGIVTVPQSAGQNAIGAGADPMPGGTDKFSTGGNGSGDGYGNAVILLAKRSSGKGGFISDTSNQAQWGGIIFQANEGLVYGTPNITESFSIPVGYNLTVNAGQSVSNDNGIKVTVDGSIRNRGEITGNAQFVINKGQIENYGIIKNRGDVQISADGKIYNGSDSDRGTAEIYNLAGATVEVDGNIYNYAKMVKEDTAQISGSGNIYNLSSVAVEVTKDGAPIGESNPVRYGDQITVQMQVSPGPYTTFPEWMPAPVEVQFKLWNGDTVSSLGTLQTAQRQTDGTVEFTQTVTVERAEGVLWEGGKELKVGATMNQVGGLQGYLPDSASETVRYDKLPIDMSMAKWSSNSHIYDGSQKTVEITGFPVGVTATYTGNEQTEPGSYNAMPALEYDIYNHELTNVPAAVGDSLTNGYRWTIEKAVPAVTAWPVASELTDGQPLSASVLTGGTVSVDGTFAWKVPGQTVEWKENQANQEFESVFTPSDTTHYASVTGTISVKVNPIYNTVTFNPNGGNFTGNKVISVQKGKKIPKPVPPTYEGASFAGWYKEESLTTLWDFDVDQVTGDMTLYAKYTMEDPVMLVAIPAEVQLVNNPTTNMGEGNGTIKVQTITDPHIGYPDKTLTIKADSKVTLIGKSKGAICKVQVYNEDGSEYSGIEPLMSFSFEGNQTSAVEHGFALKIPMDFEKPEDTYQGNMQFQLELN